MGPAPSGPGEGLKSILVPLAAPSRKMRGVETLAAQERADVTRFAAGLGLAQDIELVLGREPLDLPRNGGQPR
jgi:hypothetical protein